MTEDRQYPEACGGCGLIIGGGTAGCRALFDRLALPAPRENPLLPWRRLTVDVYAAGGNDQLRRWLNSKPRLIKPRLSPSYGEVRIDSLADAPTRELIAAAVNRWTGATWQAYLPLHAIAREWISQALAYRGHVR